MKVYCMECISYNWTYNSRFGECRNENNKTDDWHSKKLISKDKPEVINRNNNCKWFKKRKDVK